MGFFKKNNRANSNSVISIIGQDMYILGNITFKGKMRLDGKVKGNIKGEHLTLGEDGSVEGDISAELFICSGHVDGNVKASNLHVVKGSTINGVVETSDIEVESGATLNGEIKSRAKDKDVQLTSDSPILKQTMEVKTQK